MNIKAFAALLLLAVGQAALAAGPGDTVAAFHAALAAGDQKAASALLSPDVVIYESGHVERSRSEYAAHHLGHDMALARATTRKVLAHSERVGDKLAVVLDETETSGTYQGKKVHAFGTETVTLEKSGDDWLIVHAHWSSRKPK